MDNTPARRPADSSKDLAIQAEPVPGMQDCRMSCRGAGHAGLTHTWFRMRKERSVAKRRLLILISLLCLAAPYVAGASDFVAQHPKVAEAITLLEIWVEEQRLYHQVPGISVGVVYDQELIWSKGFGFSDLEKRTPVTPATLFRVGSITKVFTATAIMQLRDQGKLRLDDPITRHLPGFKIQNPFPDAPEITLWNLLTYTSGLPREAAFPYWTDHEFPTRDEILAAMATQTLIYSPGTKYKYSNLGVFLLGAVIEEVSGESYREYIEKHIFSPLGMDHSSVDPPADQSGPLATAYMRRQPDGARQVMDYYETRGMAAAGSIVSSVQDLARFAALNLRQENSTTDGEILRTSTMRAMQRPQWVYSSWTGAVGLGFRVAPRDGKNTVSHTGWIGDHRAHLLMVPDDKLAVITMINSVEPLHTLFSSGALDLLGAAIATSTAPPSKETVFDPTWTKYLGVYSDPWGWEYRVLILGNQLVVYSHEYPPAEDAEDGVNRLEYLEGDTFKFAEGEYIVFEMTDDGEVERIKRRTDYLFPVD